MHPVVRSSYGDMLGGCPWISSVLSPDVQLGGLAHYHRVPHLLPPGGVCKNLAPGQGQVRGLSIRYRTGMH